MTTFLIAIVFIGALVLGVVGVVKYNQNEPSELAEDKVKEINENNILDITLPSTFFGHYLIAKITLKNVVHRNASSLGIYYNGISSRTYTPAYDRTVIKTEEITAQCFRELFDEILKYTTKYDVIVEWVKKRDTTTGKEVKFKYCYYNSDKFTEENKSYNYLFDLYLRDIQKKEEAKQRKQEDTIRNNFL